MITATGAFLPGGPASLPAQNVDPVQGCSALTADVSSGFIIGFDQSAATEFGAIVGGRLLRGGGIVVADNQAGEVVAFSAAGRPLWRTRSGDGPGEFRRPEWLEVVGDTILVVDRLQRRITYLTERGQSVLTDPLPAQLPPNQRIAGRMADGTLAAKALRGGWPERGMYVDTFHVRLIDRSGTELRSLGPFASTELYRDARFGIGVLPLPFGREPQLQLRGDLLVIGSQAEARLLVARNAGGLVSLQVPDMSRVIPQGAFDKRVGQLVDMYPTAGQEIARGLFGEMPRRDRTPPYGDLTIDASGRIWVQRYPLPDDHETHYALVGRDGRRQEVRLPPRWTILDAEGQSVLARVMDEFDVHGVALVRLRCQ